MPGDVTSIEASSGSRVAVKAAVVILVALVFAAVYVFFGDAITLDNLSRRESELRAYQRAHSVWVYGLAFGFYVLATGLSLPGATVLTLVYGWYFGLLRAVVLVSFASTTGATLAFLLSRFLLRDMFQRRFGDRLAGFNRELEREGPFYLFTLRLIPAVPFFVINAVMGLTRIRTWTFWWVSQIGMLAGTVVYVYAGSSVPHLQTLADQGIQAVFTPRQLTQILVAFVLLGTLPLALRYALRLASRGGKNDLKSDADRTVAVRSPCDSTERARV